MVLYFLLHNKDNAASYLFVCFVTKKTKAIRFSDENAYGIRAGLTCDIQCTTACTTDWDLPICFYAIGYDGETFILFDSPKGSTPQGIRCDMA